MTIEYTKKVLNQIFWPDDDLTPEERLAQELREQACRERHRDPFHDSDGFHQGYNPWSMR